MSLSASRRQMTENEVVFRTYNERVKKNLAEIKQLAEQTGQDYLVNNDDTPLHFYCECSDENCKRRVLMKPSEYERIHKNRKHFVMLCGHETKAVERIVYQNGEYCVAEKYLNPPASAHSLHPTGVDNT